MPRARHIRTLQHTEVSKMKTLLMGETGGSMLALTARQEEGALSQQPLKAQWLTGMGMPSPRPPSHPAAPSTAGSLTQLVPRGWDPHQSWPGSEGCTAPPRRRLLPWLWSPQTRRQFSSLPHGHPCRDGSATVTLRAHRGPPRLSQGILPRVKGEKQKAGNLRNGRHVVIKFL